MYSLRVRHNSASPTLNTEQVTSRVYLTNISVPYAIFFSLYGCTSLWNLAAFFSFLILYTVGLLGWGISPSQIRYLHTDMHASSGIRTHDPIVRTGKDGSCLRPRGRCDRGDKWWIGENEKQNCRSPVWFAVLVVAMRDWRKSRKISARIVDIPAGSTGKFTELCSRCTRVDSWSGHWISWLISFVVLDGPSRQMSA
jgi:hypothetical protein